MVDPNGRIAVEIGGSFLGQFSMFGIGGSKNFAISLDLRTGNWQAGTTSSVQANVGGGLYGGVGGNFSITPGLSASVCDLAGGSLGVGGAAGVGVAGAAGQVTYGSAGPTFSGSIQYTGLGAGVAGYGTYSHTNVNIIGQGNLYQSVRSWFGK